MTSTKINFPPYISLAVPKSLLTHIRRRPRGRRLVKKSVSILLWNFSYECVQFQIEIGKISRCVSRSPNNAELSHLTLLFSTLQNTTAKKCIKNYNAPKQLLFCSLNLLFRAVLVAVMFCSAETERDFRFSLLRSLKKSLSRRCAELDARKHHEKLNQMT